MNNTIKHLDNDFEVMPMEDPEATTEENTTQEFMKAKAGFLMLLIGLMCFTGFGNTTSDLTDNSTADVIHMDLSVNVVAAPVMVVVFNSFHTEAAFVLAENTDVSPVTDFVTNIALVSPSNLPDEDVGWGTLENDLLTSKALIEPGGVLSIFYI